MLAQTPLTVFVGALGAGKTTVIRNLMRSKPAGVSVALVETDYAVAYGIEPLVEGALVQSTVWSFSGGCVCCSGGGELRASLAEAAASGAHHVWLELTGASFVGPLLSVLQSVPSLQLCLVVAVVDCSADATTLSAEAREQLTWADCVVANKTDLGAPSVDSAGSAAVYATMRGVGFEWTALVHELDTRTPLPPTRVPDGRQPHSVQMASVVLRPATRVSLSYLDHSLGALDIVRGKALVLSHDHVLHYRQWVRGRMSSTAAAPDRADAQLCVAVIGGCTRQQLVAAVAVSQAVMADDGWIVRPHVDGDVPVDWNRILRHVFANEPITASYRGMDIEESMWRDTVQYGVYTASKNMSAVALHPVSGQVGAFALCKPFVTGADAGPGPSQAIDDMLLRVQSGLTADLLAQRGLHVSLIGRVFDSGAPRGLVKSALLVALRMGFWHGFQYALAETSSAQSTWLCVSLGAEIRKTVLYRESPYEPLKSIADWADRNTDAIAAFGPDAKLVPSSLRLVVWDLVKCAKRFGWDDARLEQ